MTYDETMSLPFGLLNDLIAIEQIRNENAERKKTKIEEQEEFEQLMSYK